MQWNTREFGSVRLLPVPSTCITEEVIILASKNFEGVECNIIGIWNVYLQVPLWSIMIGELRQWNVIFPI